MDETMFEVRLAEHARLIERVNRHGWRDGGTQAQRLQDGRAALAAALLAVARRLATPEARRAGERVAPTA